nr:reverse transcriptase domain-containing protein [Tanacetum cinerariifolium]
MGYEHLSITPETKSDEVTESNAENLLPIPSESEVALEDKEECIVPISENFPDCDNHSDTFSDSKIDDDILVYDNDFEDIEYVEASLLDLEIVSIEEENGEEEENAYENSLIYKEQTKKLHDDKIKNRIFNVGDQVLLFNSRLKIFSGKLKSCWSGPFTISEIYPYGIAKLIHPDGCNFKVNCHRLKHYHGGDSPSLEIPDVNTFPKDN